MKSDNYMEVIATLKCGTGVRVYQRERGMIVEFEVTPPTGIPIEDTADIKDGKLNIRMTIESLIGLYQLLGLLTFPVPRHRKKFLGVF